MQIRINGVSEENKGKYRQLTVSYNQDGKDKEKKLMSFKDQDVYKLIADSNSGDAFDITSIKDGNFWNWTAAKFIGKSNSAAEGKTQQRTTTSSYPSSEERALTQVYIIRQSACKIAFESFKELDEDPFVLAQKIEQWVLRTEKFEADDPEVD